MVIKTGFGQDSHRFEQQQQKPLVLAGVKIDYPHGLAGNSDADVVLHALTNAISSITARPILGDIADKLCQQGVVNSDAYLQIARDDLRNMGYQISHIAISIEAKEPPLSQHFGVMRQSISQLLKISQADVGITATSGEGLNHFGQALGVQCFVLITVFKPQ